MDLHNDDQPVGRVLSRRRLLIVLGWTGASVVAGTGLTKLGQVSKALAQAPTATATPIAACVVQPALTEGPYFVDEMLNRTDIRVEPSDGSVKPGAQLRLLFNVSKLNGEMCAPLPGAQVDVWHCDGLGLYSDVENQVGKKFLRGYQVTDETGAAEFLTIYPGWYPGRTTHIHFKIRTDPASDKGYEFTSQLFFDDAFTDQVYTQQPYSSKGNRGTRNKNDGIYLEGGEQLILNVEKEKDKDGYTATFNIALDTSQPSTASSGGPGGGGQRPGGPPPQGGSR